MGFVAWFLQLGFLNWLFCDSGFEILVCDFVFLFFFCIFVSYFILSFCLVVLVSILGFVVWVLQYVFVFQFLFSGLGLQYGQFRQFRKCSLNLELWSYKHSSGTFVLSLELLLELRITNLIQKVSRSPTYSRNYFGKSKSFSEDLFIKEIFPIASEFGNVTDIIAFGNLQHYVPTKVNTLENPSFNQ